MPRGGDAGGGKKGSSVQFSRPQEPSFLRDLKKQVGYKDPVEDMNAKVYDIDFLVLGCGVIIRFQLMWKQLFIHQCIYIQKITAEGLDNNQEERDDEKPTIVVLNEGDLTAEEAEKLNSTLQTGKLNSRSIVQNLIQ